MGSAQYFKDTSLWLWNCYLSVLVEDAVADDIRRWLELGEAAVNSANVFVRSPTLTVADKQKIQPSVEWDDVESAFESRIKTGVITNRKHLDVSKFLKDAQKQFVLQVNQTLQKETTLKVNTVLAAEYVNVKNGEEVSDIKYFNTKTVPVYSSTDLNEWFASNVVQPIDADSEEYQEQESGWTLRTVLNLIVNINKLNPMLSKIKELTRRDLPEVIKNKRACINVMNRNDDQCFKWAILSALHPVSVNGHRVSSYTQHESKYNFTGMTFPVDPKDVSKFEKQNDVSVNVYFMKKKGEQYTVLPRHLTEQKKDKHVNLLLVESDYIDEDEENEDESKKPYTFHYV